MELMYPTVLQYIYTEKQLQYIQIDALVFIYTLNSGKVFNHLPSHHNTSYNNRNEDRWASGGGTITNVED